MYAGFKKFARKKTDNLFGNDKKKAAGKAEHLNDKAPKNVVKHTDPQKGPVKTMEKPAPGKQKPTEINSKAPDTDVPNAPATKHTPEMKNTDPAPSNTNVEKLEKDIHPENSPVDKADAPKDQKVANGEKEPQSAVLNDDPNIEESNLKDLKKYEDNVDPSTKKKMKDKADGEVEKGPNHNSKTKALVMARIIAETNDKADTPVPVLMGELAALKAMKGVTGFGYKNGNAPGEFRILMYGSEYTVDPSYTTSNDKDIIENENSPLPDGNKVPESVLTGKRPSKPEYTVISADGNLTDYGKWYYKRPSWKKKTINDTWKNAKNHEGKVYDRQSKEEIIWHTNKPRGEQWHMGHKEGYEFYKHQASAAKRGIGIDEFRNEYNIAEHIEPELPISNLSHKGEAPKDIYYGF